MELLVDRYELQRALRFRIGDLDLMQLIPENHSKFLRSG